MKKRTVALYGRNLVLSAIGACLEKNASFEVRHIDNLFEIETRFPDVILFEFETARFNLALNWMRDHSEIMLIGVDLMKNRLVVLSGGSSRLMTIDDLVNVIKKKSSPAGIPTANHENL